MYEQQEHRIETPSMELLAPAGGFEQLQAAIDFGADAVYLAADRFGMRARATNFSMEDIADAVKRAHAAGVKVHVACNVMMLPEDMKELPAYFETMDDLGVDALIIGDLGAFSLARKYAPRCDLHVSTQASVSNGEAAKMWHALGAARIVCAREMSLIDIAALRRDIPEDLEIEAFVHGAQCMAMSGRCLISSYLTGRSANQGNCTQPCRWNYTLEEEKRPGVHFPIGEDTGGTFLMNAMDLNMIEHLGEMAEAGVDSIKIEGRNKKAFYVATVVGAYRRALDAIGSPAYCEELLSDLQAELSAVSHRPFSTGFYFGDPKQATDFDGYEQETIHVADVVECVPDQDIDASYTLTLRCRNRFAEGDVLEILSPGRSSFELTVANLRWLPESAKDVDGLSAYSEYADVQYPDANVPVEVANRSCNLYLVDCERAVQPGSFVRMRTYRRSARHS